MHWGGGWDATALRKDALNPSAIMANSSDTEGFRKNVLWLQNLLKSKDVFICNSGGKRI